MVLESLLFLSFLQELIKEQVANMYLWPRTLDVQILDIAKYISEFGSKFSYETFVKVTSDFVLSL